MGIDDIGSAALAAEHLLALGHRKIAYVGRDYPEAAPRKTPIDRLEGFHQAMSRAGINTPPTWVLDSTGPLETRAPRPWPCCLVPTGRPRSSPPPTRWPSVCGAQPANSVWRCRGTCPSSGSTTTSWPRIRPHHRASGCRRPGVAAASTLLALLGLYDPSAIPDQTFPVELVIRGSTTAPAKP